MLMYILCSCLYNIISFNTKSMLTWLERGLCQHCAISHQFVSWDVVLSASAILGKETLGGHSWQTKEAGMNQIAMGMWDRLKQEYIMFGSISVCDQ